jgi:hypothetical protein
MKEIIEILMKRDGLSFDNASDVVNDLREQLTLMVDEGSGLTEIEDYFSDELGLEPDYLFEVLDF